MNERAAHRPRRAGATSLLLALALALAAAACGGDPRRARGWRDGPAAPEARLEAAAAALDGRIYFIGGITGIESDMTTARPSARVDVLDPLAGTWTRGPDLPDAAPKHHLAVAVAGGRLYILGGFDGIIGRGLPTDAFRPIPTTWVLDGDRWRRLADAPLARGGATAQAINGRIYVAGGTRDEGVPPYADVFEYDPDGDRWTRRAPLAVAREHVASCALDGRMLVFGGWVGAPRTAQSAAESYDPTTDRWTTLPAMPTARGGLGAAVLGASCHVVGGEDWNLPSPGTFASNEALEPREARWRADPPMRFARHGAGVVAFGGEIYVIGGGPRQGNSYTDAVEIFTP